MRIASSSAYLDTSALAKVYVAEPESAAVEAAMVLRDVVEKEFRSVELTRSVHREAERLMMTLGNRVALRAADGLHLALAAAAGARTLVTFDGRMVTAARALGTFELVE